MSSERLVSIHTHTHIYVLNEYRCPLSTIGNAPVGVDERDGRYTHSSLDGTCQRERCGGLRSVGEDAIYFILEIPLRGGCRRRKIRRGTRANRRDVSPGMLFLPPARSPWSTGGMAACAKCISRSRRDKKRICMPAICNPSRRMPSGGAASVSLSRISPLVNNTAGESA